MNDTGRKSYGARAGVGPEPYRHEQVRGEATCEAQTRVAARRGQGAALPAASRPPPRVVRSPRGHTGRLSLASLSSLLRHAAQAPREERGPCPQAEVRLRARCALATCVFLGRESQKVSGTSGG